MTFLSQFAGKPFWWTFAGLVALDVASFLTLHTAIEPVLFALVIIGLIRLAVKRPEWLFPIAMAEIIATSNGHSLNIELAGISIGIRILLFAILMLVSLVQTYKERANPIPKQYRVPVLLLLLLLVYGVTRGVLAGYDLRDVYLDANGYLAIGYLLAALVWVRSAASRRLLLQAIGAGATWIIAKTLLLFFAFGHLHPKTLDPLYTWIRDTRLGEITLQAGNVYRVFLQSQWFIIPSLFFTASYMLLAERGRETGVRLVYMLAFAAIIASLSRTFWLALAATVLVMIVYVFWKKGIGRLVSRIPGLTLTKIGAIALLWILIAVPIFQTVGTNIFGELLRDRATGTNDIALDSRRQLLNPMFASFAEAPVAGHGLGKNVTYETLDQRYIDSHDTNVVSTYAFEWGWIDFLVKFGVVGTFIFLVLFWLIASDLWQASRQDKDRAWIYIALLASLIALLIAHTFSPYLNHPIGWGTLAIMVALTPRHTEKRAVTVDKGSPVPVLNKVKMKPVGNFRK